MTKLPMTKLSAPDDRTSRLVVAAAVGILVFGLVVLFALLVADVDDEDSGHSSHRCPGYAVGTVDPVTCLLYGSAGAPPAGTNHAGSNSSTPRKPAAPPKAPGLKAPAAPKVPAAPAAKAPAPPVRSTRRKAPQADTVRPPSPRTGGTPVSEPVSCPKPAPCSRETPCPRCARLLRVMVVCWGLILVLVVAILASVVVHSRGSSSDPKSAPSTQAPADPSPTSAPTSEQPPATPQTTLPIPSGTCNLFDPECESSTRGGVGG
ncbi:hypothetical protein [Streptomyces chartreusis]|uniref:hypothetical protein n=1 Tax=Streptomyces chartreusis TaxID=1969 RepID=UPI00369D30CB